MSGRRGVGAERVLTKLKSHIDNQNFYEAHQMYRTLYFRYLGQKKYGELETMLFDGATLLFSKDESASGTDLAKLYVDTLKEADQVPEDVHFQRMSKMYKLIPRDSVDKPVFLTACLKLSNNTGSPIGHPRLHQYLAYALWEEKEFPESRQHFLHSKDGAGCGKMLIEFQTLRGFPSELDVFIAQTVFQFLCLKKSLMASAAFHAYTSGHPTLQSEAKGPPFATYPLLNFLWMLLISIQSSASLPIYTTLCETYKPAIEKDPQYFEYLDKIGQHFFGVPAPVKKPKGMFSGLIDQLMNAMNDDDSDDEAAGAGPSGSTKSSAEKEDSASKSKLVTEDLD